MGKTFQSALSPHYRSLAERFGIPYTFAPDLAVSDAIIAIAGALARIFLGSLWFAIWGVYTAIALSSIASPVWRAVALVPLVFLFGATLAGVMIAIGAVVNRFLAAGHPSK